jgi:photosystem II stability/assembly factor-like uncharacterized protein
VEDLSLRTEFHLALDAVAPSAPWLADHVRQDLRKRVAASRPARRPRTRWGLVLRPTTRRVIAAVLVVLLVVAAAGASLALYRYIHQPIPIRPHPGAVTRACGQGKVYMVDPSNGWQGTQKTTDGGKTWHDVSPPTTADFVKGGNTVCTFDAGHAWVTSGGGSGTYQPDHLVVQATSDGGQSWQRIAVIPLGYTADWRINLSVEMDFYDDKNGWLLTEYASSPIQRTLYATSDGGHAWNAVSRTVGLGLSDLAHNCVENGMMFVSLQRGWLSWDCSRGFGDQPAAGGLVIAVTNDGGRTWAPLHLAGVPNSVSCTVSTPVFTRNDGIMQVSCTGLAQGGWTAVYSTTDTGQSWTAHILTGWFSVDLVDGTTAFYFATSAKTNTLYRTTDGGNTWSVVASGLFPGNPVSSFLFIDEMTAYANVSNSPVAWWTYDGGKTWSPPGTNRSVGSVVCTQPSDPAAGTAPTGVKMVSATTGWAAGGRRTTDGGATWTHVGPPHVKNSTSGYAEYFLDATHAWVAEAVGSASACADHFVIFSSSDGGATWRQGSQAAVKVDPNFTVPGSWTMSLSFVDRDHGWLWVQTAAGFAGYAPGPLYRTQDGGRSWTMVASSAAWSGSGCRSIGQPVFSSASTGWLSAICEANPPWSMSYLVTHNGGVTWTRQTLMPSLCCTPPSPRFFDVANGWVFEPNTPLLMMTTDGGTTWTQHGLPSLPALVCQGKHGENVACSDEAFDAVTFLNPNQGWAVISQFSQAKGGAPHVARFERTADGGKTWSPVSSNLVGSTTDLSQATMTFVDPSHGFLWAGTVLLTTSNGGQTWNEIQMTYR